MSIINRGILDSRTAYLRQVGNDWPTAQVVYTADILESSGNLYFTTARVASNVATLMKSFQGSGLTIDAANGQINIVATSGVGTANVANFASIANVANTVLSLAGHTTSEIIEGSNLYYTDARVNVAVRPILTTANVIETSSNLYFTYARANSAIWPSLTAANIANFASTVNTTVQPFLTTANVIETSSNLYFTTARVNTTIQPFLTTANVIETSSNLYFTTARVAANVATLMKSFQGSGLTIDAANGQINIIASGGGGSSNVANTVISLAGHTTTEIIEGSNLYYTDARVNVAVRPILTTANVIETSSNLYFTTARANAAIWPSLTAANIANFVSTVNATVQPFLTTANVIETAGNLYFTTARVNATIQPFLTTANVVETSSNLYFTTARVAANVTTLLKSFQGSGLTIDAANGQININTVAASVPQLANVANTVISLAGHTTTEINEGSNLYYTDARVNVAIRPILTTANVIETSSNLYFTTARVASNVATLMKSFQGSGLTIDAANGQINVVANSIANFVSTVNATIQPFLTTANVIEVSSNLYFTTARVNATVQPFLTTANVIETVGNLYFTYARVNATVQPFLTTANVIETSGNLYFTNARVIAALSNATITGNLFITGGNLYVTDSIFANNLILRGINATSNILSGGTITASGFTGNTLTVDVVTSNTWNRLYTANVIETSGNLYFTNARVNAVIQPFLTTANVIETSGNLYFTAARVNTTVQPFLTTANVTESASNLYFTNSRVVSALQAGDNIVLYANGQINAYAYSSILISDSRTIVSTGNATYSMGTVVTDPKRIFVAIEGVTQIPVLDYNVSGSDITFDSGPPIGANIEVKFFGTEYIALSTTAAISSKVDNFIASSANLTYTLSLTPPNKDFITVVLNGNTLSSTAYTLSSNRVTLAFAPPTGANLDIRTISGRSGSIFNTRTFTGTGSANTFGISAGFNQHNILVFENGVSQVPGTDYIVNNDYLIFTTPPAANVVVQVRELAVPINNAIANVVTAFRGYDFTSGSILPSDGTKVLGNVTSRWNTVYANAINISNTTIGVSSAGALTLTTSGTTSTVATVGDSANYPHPFLLSLL